LKPARDQIEVTLIGPGYGECGLVHLGNGRWIVIDSCINKGDYQPAALSYLNGIGVNPQDAVSLVLATHWHDDHIRGLGKMIAACPNAKFCCSTALTSDEFLAIVSPYEHRASVPGGSGVSEFFEVLKHLSQRVGGNQKQPIWATANRRIFTLAAAESGHGTECEVWTLSPSDKQLLKFLYELTRLMPSVKETKCRIIPQDKNDLSVVTWIRIGNLSLLFGADLEDSGDSELGWSAIVASADRPDGRAKVFKIPHHGSHNGHHDRVWSDMVVDRPYAILCPFSRGTKKLPSITDVNRIIALTPQAYSTARFPKSRTVKSRTAPVEKMIRETVGKIREAEAPTGWVRLRNDGLCQQNRWVVELSQNACRLSDLHH
jgi:hypothetical protein